VTRCFTNSAALLEKSRKESISKDAVKPLGIPYEKLTVGIPKETFPLERRVAATPESVARLVKPGFKVQVEDGAGMPSYFSNQDFQNAGAAIVDDVWKTSDIVLKVRGRERERVVTSTSWLTLDRC
jgi:H+-translocating NAD(P) transhydrogenase